MSHVCIHCRAREAELEKQFQLDLANSKAEHLRKTQDMLTEFSHAQQILKDKILKQQKMYVFLLLALISQYYNAVFCSYYCNYYICLTLF